MSLHAGIDVRRKHPQVAVADRGGEVLVNRNVSNVVKPIVSMMGGLAVGTQAGFGAALVPGPATAPRRSLSRSRR